MGKKVVWFTGLSGSGKTTIAQQTAEILRGHRCNVTILDGDGVRAQLHPHLGFSSEDIRENNRLIAEKCQDLTRQYDIILVAIISPFRESRADARRTLGRSFIEVYIRASLDEVIRRDPKGIYSRSRQGKLAGVIGIAPEVPYQPPESPDLILDTEKNAPEACAKQLADFLLENRPLE